MIKAAIFDLDGTISDSEQLWTKARIELLKKEKVKKPKLYLKHRAQLMGLESKQALAFLKKKFSLKKSLKELCKAQEFIVIEIFKKELKAMPGAIEFLLKLKCKVKLGLASSSPSRIVKFELNKLKLAGLFDVVVFKAKRGKPWPDIFLKAAKTLKVKPSECVVFEDSLVGIAAAKAAGMRCIAFRHKLNKNLDFSLADKIIESWKIEPEEVLKWKKGS